MPFPQGRSPAELSTQTLSIPEAFDRALPADRALSLVFYLLGKGHSVKDCHPHHRLWLQVSPFQELGSLDGWLPISLEEDKEGKELNTVHNSLSQPGALPMHLGDGSHDLSLE